MSFQNVCSEPTGRCVSVHLHPISTDLQSKRPTNQSTTPQNHPKPKNTATPALFHVRHHQPPQHSKYPTLSCTAQVSHSCASERTSTNVTRLETTSSEFFSSGLGRAWRFRTWRGSARVALFRGSGESVQESVHSTGAEQIKAHELSTPTPMSSTIDIAL